MYHKMFNAVTDAMGILKKAQLKSEEEYIKSSEEDSQKLTMIKINNSKTKDL